MNIQKNKLTRWNWDKPIQSVTTTEAPLAETIIIFEIVNTLQTIDLPKDIPIIFIGPRDHLLLPNEIYLAPPQLPSDLGLWDRSQTVFPKEHPLGWCASVHQVNFFWIHSKKVEFAQSGWNQYVHWIETAQKPTPQTKYQLNDPIFIENGIGQIDNQIYYRVGSTHSGRITTLTRSSPQSNWHINFMTEFPLFVKELKYPIQPKWSVPNEITYHKTAWTNWINCHPTPFQTPIDRLWDLWQKSNGPVIGRIKSPHKQISWTTSIKVENLLGFSSPHHFWDWTNMNLMGYGMVVGTNTSGKSSWVDVWSFGFWGQTVRTKPKGILRHGTDHGWVEITWTNLSGEEGKLRREIHRYEASNIHRMNLSLYRRENSNASWSVYEGRHQRGETDVKSPAKRVQMDLEEWTATFDVAKETSLLGVDGQGEIWQRTKNEWNKTLHKFMWMGRQQNIEKTENDIQEEDIPNIPKLGIPKQEITSFIANWFQKESLILLDSSTGSFISNPNDIQYQLNRSLFAFEKHIRDQFKKTQLEPTEEEDLTAVCNWVQQGLMKEWCEILSNIWNSTWADGRLSLTWDSVSASVQLAWYPLGGTNGTELGMACRWERMMIMEGWRLLILFMNLEAGNPVIADVWLDEEWDGVDEVHGKELLQKFGGWHGTHVIISHQEHWKRQMSFVVNMTPNARHNQESNFPATE